MKRKTTISPVDVNDLWLFETWAAREGWNPGLDDLAAFYSADPGAFLIGKAGETPVAIISAVRYGANFGFIGFYICHPMLRGQGFGHEIWDVAINRLQHRVVGLDGVIEQQDNYRKSGFQFAHRSVRFVGQVACDMPTDARLVQLSHSHFPLIQDYDRHFFPDNRTAFLKPWTDPAVRSRIGFALINGGSVQGYGVIRHCQQGVKIGPLFAETQADADVLFQALVSTAKRQPVVLDAPEPNQHALALAELYGLSPSFETARMYKGEAPDLPLGRTFGITTFELG